MQRRSCLVLATLIVAGFLFSAASSARAAQAISDGDWQFVRTMLFDGSFPDEKWRTVSRWANGPRVELYAHGLGDRTLFRDAMRVLSTLLAPAGVTFPAPNDKAQLIVVIQPRADILRDGAEAGIRCVEELNRRPSVTCWRRAPDGSLEQALVLVPDDLFSVRLPAMLMEGLFGALGVPNHTSEEPSSLMYVPKHGERPIDQRISRLDARLLLFLYLYVRPGDDEAAVRAAFDRHWADITLPPLTGPLVSDRFGTR